MTQYRSDVPSLRSLILPVLHTFWRSHSRLWATTAIVWLTLLLACTGLSTVLLINQTAKLSSQDTQHPFMPQSHWQLSKTDQSAITLDEYVELRNAGWSHVVAVLDTHLTLTVKNTERRVNVIGVDTLALLSLPDWATDVSETSTSVEISPFSFHPALGSTIGIHPEFARHLGWDAKGEGVTHRGKVVGQLHILNAPGLGPQVVTDLLSLLQATGNRQISALMVLGPKDQPKVKDLAPPLPDGWSWQALPSAEDQQQLTKSFHLNLLAMAMLMFVVGMFVIMNALHLSLQARAGLFRQLRQFGVPLGIIVLGLIIELLLMSLSSAWFGAWLGSKWATFLSPSVSLTLQNLYDAPMSFEQPAWSHFALLNLVAALVGSTLAISLPLKKLRQQLLSNSDDKKSKPKGTLGFHVIAPVTLLLIALLWQYSTLASSFVLVACLLILGCLLMILILPVLLGWLAKFTPQKWPLMHYINRDAVRVSHASRIAFCAFFIALAANIGMNLMVNSFRHATDHWLTTRLNADAYVSTDQMTLVKALLEQQFAGLDWIPRISLDGEANQKGAEILDYPATPQYQQTLLFARAESNIWERFSQQQGVLINQQMALRNQYQLGQSLLVRFPNNEQQVWPIIGIYYDYGNPKDQLMLPMEVVPTLNSEEGRLALHFSGAQSLEPIRLALASIAGQHQLYGSEDILQIAMQTFDRTFVITSGLNVVTLMVAAFSLATSILIIDRTNRPQRALIRALGISAPRLFTYSLLQYVLLCLLVCFVAIPFGALLAYVLIEKVNVSAFYWSYPLLIDVLPISQGILISLIVVVIFALLPLYRSRTRPLMEQIKCLE